MRWLKTNALFAWAKGASWLLVSLSAFLVLGVTGQGELRPPTFREKTLAAIAILPEWAQFQLNQGYVRAIQRVDAFAGADLRTGEIRVTDIIWHGSTAWYASQLVHESYHLWACYTGHSPAGGIVGEAKATRYQQVALQQMGRGDLADSLQAAIGVHGAEPDYPTDWASVCTHEKPSN